MHEWSLKMKPLRSKTLLLFLLGGIALVMVYCVYGVSVWKGQSRQSLFGWLYMMWSTESTEAVDYSHGLFIPFVSLWLLWRKRTSLKESFRHAEPNVLGVLLCALGLVMHASGLRMQIPHLSALAFIVSIWALIWCFVGRRAAVQCFFPIVFLVFAIPVGFLSRATFPLRILGSVSAAALLNGMGIDTVREGTAVFSSVGQGFALDVADACSGIRSMASLMALTAAYAYVFRQRLFGRWFLFCLSIPIAAIANIGRIVTIGLVAVWFGQGVGMKLYHDWSGYLIFVLSVFLLVGANSWMDYLIAQYARLQSRNRRDRMAGIDVS